MPKSGNRVTVRLSVRRRTLGLTLLVSLVEQWNMAREEWLVREEQNPLTPLSWH